jgi:hypothetical protein
MSTSWCLIRTLESLSRRYGGGLSAANISSRTAVRARSWSQVLAGVVSISKISRRRLARRYRGHNRVLIVSVDTTLKCGPSALQYTSLTSRRSSVVCSCSSILDIASESKTIFSLRIVRPPVSIIICIQVDDRDGAAQARNGWSCRRG